jgi:2'-5' RNA ligase
MRLFLAFPLDDAVRAALTEMQSRLRATGADVRWVAPENLHLTIAFLGDQTEGNVENIEALAGHVAKTAKPFRIGVRGGSYFPRKGPLKTVWVGLSEGAREWKTLAQATEATFAPFGVPPGNDLVPHLTLGRVKGPEGMDALRAALATEADTDCGAQNANRLVLMQSFLNSTGATYRELRSWPLSAI